MSVPSFFKFDIKRNKYIFSKFKNLLRHRRNNEAKSIVKRVFDSVPPTSVVNNNGETLLHLAAKYNNIELINFLVESGCAVNVKNSFGQTPLSAALFSNRWKAVEILMNVYMDVCTNDDQHLLQLLITKKDTLPASISITFMQKFKRYSKDLEIIAALFVKVSCPLMFIVYVGDACLTQMMLEMPDFEIDQKDSVATLRYVMEVADFENLRILWQSIRMVQYRSRLLYQISCSIIYSSPVEWGYTKPLFKRLTDWIIFDQSFINFLKAMFTLIGKGGLEVLLQQYNIDEQIRKKYKFDILPILFNNCQLDIQYLIYIVHVKQFNVNAQSVEGLSALHFASLIESQNNIRLLLELGADCNIKDDNGLTPLCYASDTKCVELLLQSGADFHVADNEGVTVIEKLDHFEDSWEVVLAHLAIDHCRGVQIKQKVLKEINGKQTFKNCYEICLKQVEELINYQILPSLTLFDVATMKAKNLANKVKSRKIICTAMEWCSEKSLHAYYSSLLKLNLEAAYNTNRAKCRVATIISEIVSRPIDFDHLIVDSICNYLSYKDMLVFVSL